jgi:hypothetical protein
MTDSLNESHSQTPGDMRVGDADRQASADRLAAHAAAGRLSVDELEARAAAAHAAVYARELSSLEADLPSSSAHRVARGSSPSAWPPLLVALVGLCVLTSVAIGHPVGFPLLLAFVVWRLIGGRSRSRFITARSYS